MSRIGKVPLDVPKEVKVKVDPSNVHIEGSKGKIDLKIPDGITVEFKDQKIFVNRQSDSKQDRASHGTIRSILENNIIGVTKGHKRELEIQGIGFRAQAQGKKILFNLGLSHPIEFLPPDSIKVTVANQTSITVEGADNDSVGQVASKIRALKPAEPYKGKGVRFLGEVIRRKQGKSVAK